MKMQKKIIVTLLLVLSLVLTGCSGGKDDGFAVGAWNGTTFENTWLNMKFPVSDNWTISTDEEIAQLNEISTDSDDAGQELLDKIAELKTVYGFMITENETFSNVQLIYENLAMSIGGTKMSEQEYLDSAMEMLPSEDYELLETVTKDIAGKTFTVAKMSAYDGVYSQDFYCYKQGKHMVVMIMSYTPDQAAVIDEFVSGITTLE
jgi:hypothetical protein